MLKSYQERETARDKKPRLDEVFVELANIAGIDPVEYFAETRQGVSLGRPEISVRVQEGHWKKITHADAHVHCVVRKSGRYAIVDIECRWGSTNWDPTSAYAQAKACMRAADIAVRWEAVTRHWAWTEKEVKEAVQRLETLNVPLPDESE